MIGSKKVNWIPAHPSYGSISMLRYWKLLASEAHFGDPYHCRSIIPVPEESTFGRGSKFQRAWQRQIAYPLRVSFTAEAPIAHILDHSWAEMLDFMPRGTRTVVTVHDLIPLRDSGGLSPSEVARYRARVLRLKNADAVIADSEYTKSEVHSFLEIPLAKIHVVPCGVEMPDSYHTPRERPDGVFRIGSIGSTLRRKNLEILPSALRALRETSDREPLLIRVGALLPPQLAAEVRQALGVGGLHEMGRLDDSELAAFYASLDCVVIPSLYEGFGLPVLEGLAAGVPVICSNTTSLPEVGGDAAIYFDPSSPDELADRLRSLERDGVPTGWTERGRSRAESFSWRASIEGIYKVYDTLLP